MALKSELDDIEIYFDDYQELASKTAIYPEEFKVWYTGFGLIGELGEFCNKYKKTVRDGTDLDLEKAIKELGDIQWYIAMLANDLGISLGYIARTNLEKLADRQERGVLGGSGDDR